MEHHALKNVNNCSNTNHRHHIKKQNASWKIPTALFVWLVLFTAVAKITLEEQALLEGT